MTRPIALLWATAIIAVAALNIAGILPDWTPIAAILTLPLLAVGSARRCGASQ